MPTAPRAASPFDPEGVEWTSVSPRLATARRITLGIVLGVMTLAVAVLALTLDSLIWAALVLVTAFGVWQWTLIGRQVRAWGYAEREDDLLVRHGILYRQLVVVPYGRMQYVDVQAGPLDRAVGIAGVQLHTASAGTDAHIPGLEPHEADRLRDRLASRGQARLAGL